MYRLLSIFALIVTTALAGAACDSDEPTTPTEPSPVEITEPFSGTLTINGARTHEFVVQRAGNVIAQITLLSPDPDAVIGLSLGTWNGQSCQIIIANDAATTLSTAVGTATSTGNFCVRVFDANGTLTGPVDYELSVRHF